MSALYQGGSLKASAGVAAALKARKVGVKPGAAKGSIGDWKGTPIAVISSGKDVTLAVKLAVKAGKHDDDWQVVGGWWPSLGVTSQLGGDRRVLLIGSDARTSKGQRVDRSRADSLHIVGVDGKGGGGILGIARDAYVPLSTGGMNKINAAMVFGGPQAELKTVRTVTGLPIEGYLLSGFGGVKKSIDALGGLPFVAPRDVVDKKGSGADVAKGKQHLTGKEVLAYARARHGVPDGDFGRSRNQGLVVLAGAALVRLGGPTRLPATLARIAPQVQTNLSAAQVLTLAATILEIDPARVHNRVAKGGFGTTAGGASIVRLDGAARRDFADLRDGNLS